MKVIVYISNHKETERDFVHVSNSNMNIQLE